jgi:gamma-glutamylcysteine synthetase
MEDWEAHLTTIFPEVRLKRYIEMRGADGGPWNMICALPALWVGLLYSKEAQAKCLELISGWTQDDREYLREEVRTAWLLADWQLLHILRACAAQSDLDNHPACKFCSSTSASTLFERHGWGCRWREQASTRRSRAVRCRTSP